MRNRFHIIAVAALLVCAGEAQAQRRIGDLCRVKGQEETTLHGLGLVVGLAGTGDSDLRPTTRALAQMFSHFGNPLPKDAGGQDLLLELKNAKNVALVLVTATIPATGAREGGRINCQVSAVSAKSLAGGHLVMTPLLGPHPGSQRVYAVAQGKVELEDPLQPVAGVVHNGCRLEESFFNAFLHDGVFTLVLDRNHASWRTAFDIADLINALPDAMDGAGIVARAVDQVNIVVRIPSQYRQDPVFFISNVLNERVLVTNKEARVVINERAGTIVIGDEVEIGPVAVSHRNLNIDAGQPPEQFAGVDPSAQNNPRLKSLVQALNAVKAPTDDVIEIIKGLDRNGNLYGKLIIE